MHLAHLTTFPTVTKIKYDRKQNRHAYTHTHTYAHLHACTHPSNTYKRLPPMATPLLCKQQANLGSYHASDRSYSNTKQK